VMVIEFGEEKLCQPPKARLGPSKYVGVYMLYYYRLTASFRTIN